MNVIMTCRRGISTVMLLALLPSCVSYHNATPPELSSSRPRDYRVTMLDQRQLVLTQALVQSDTVRGFTGGAQGERRRTQTIPLSEVRVIEVRQFHKVRAAAITLLTLSAIVGYLAATWEIPL